MNDFRIQADHERGIWTLQAGNNIYTVDEMFAVLKDFLKDHGGKDYQPRTELGVNPMYKQSVSAAQFIDKTQRMEESELNFSVLLQIFLGSYRQERLWTIAQQRVADGLFPDFAYYKRARLLHWLLRKRLMATFFKRGRVSALCH